MTLVERLRHYGPRISAQVIAEMWQDPFWAERFGERGRRNADKDGSFHIDYLVEAVEMGDAAVMERYASWLQSVLTTRGMSTRHLDDNFARLAQAIAREIPDSEKAIACLEAARRALRYPSGPARELQDACERLSPREDVRYVIAHLADAVALGRPELFAAHAKWLVEIGEAHRVRGALSAIASDAQLSEEAKRAARTAAG